MSGRTFVQFSVLQCDMYRATCARQNDIKKKKKFLTILSFIIWSKYQDIVVFQIQWDDSVHFYMHALLIIKTLFTMYVTSISGVIELAYNEIIIHILAEGIKHKK